MQITLSNNEVVTMIDYIPHKADVAFWDAVAEQTKVSPDGNLNVLGYKRCLEVLVPILIVSDKKMDDLKAWIGDLPQGDYASLEKAAEQIRQKFLDATADGEKKD